MWCTCCRWLLDELVEQYRTKQGYIHHPAEVSQSKLGLGDGIPVNCEPNMKYTPFFLYMAGASICSGKRCTVEVTLV